MRHSTHLCERPAPAAHLDGPVFETARMHRNGRPPEDIARVLGVTTFELG